MKRSAGRHAEMKEGDVVIGTGKGSEDWMHVAGGEKIRGTSGRNLKKHVGKKERAHPIAVQGGGSCAASLIAGVRRNCGKGSLWRPACLCFFFRYTGTVGVFGGSGLSLLEQGPRAAPGAHRQEGNFASR